MQPNYLIKAIAACEEALENQTENQSEWEKACRTLGNILQGMGWFDDALVWHSRLLESQHNLVEVYADLGKLCLRLEQWEEAIATYERILKINPDYLPAYWSLGEVYHHLGDKEQENEYLFQVLTRQPEKATPKGHYKLGKSFEEMGKIERAQTCYLRSIQENPTFLSAYYDLAEIIGDRGQWEEAISYYNQILEQNPQEATAHYYIGHLWLEQENYAQAIAEFCLSVNKNPHLVQYYLQVVLELNRRKKFDEVITLCRAIITSESVYPWVYIQIANALANKGEERGAILCYQKAGQLRGWQLCVDKDYQFTKDHFNYKIELFQKFLEPFANQAKVSALEIGCFQGMSTCWLLDNILTHATARITCIDSQFTPEFTTNIHKTGVSNKVNSRLGKPEIILAKLQANSYHVVNIQDKCKLPERAKKNAELSWKLLKKEGIMIFNDYAWKNPAKPQKEPRIVIEAFLKTVENQFTVLYRAQQLIIQKIAI